MNKIIRSYFAFSSQDKSSSLSLSPCAPNTTKSADWSLHPKQKLKLICSRYVSAFKASVKARHEGWVISTFEGKCAGTDTRYLVANVTFGRYVHSDKWVDAKSKAQCNLYFSHVASQTALCSKFQSVFVFLLPHGNAYLRRKFSKLFAKINNFRILM